jgi:hypothetical protein
MLRMRFYLTRPQVSWGVRQQPGYVDMQPCRHWVGVIAIGAACCSRGSSPAPSPSVDPIAVITRDEARFYFPPETRTDWRWPPPAPPPDDARYAWGATIETKDTAYLVSAMVRHVDHPGALTSLSQAITSARTDLFLIAPGSHIQQGVNGTTVRAAVQDGRLVLILHGREVVARVFRAHPTTVRLGMLGPIAPLWRPSVVPTVYTTK